MFLFMSSLSTSSRSRSSCRDADEEHIESNRLSSEEATSMHRGTIVAGECYLSRAVHFDFSSDEHT